jgi:glycosyltransferase involved in cell wall biosynthesis
MKILWMHSHFSHWMGGTVFIFELLKKIRKDYSVEIVIQNGNHDVVSKFSSENFIVHNLDSPSTNVKSFWFSFFRSCTKDAKKIQEIVDSNGFDIVITSMFPTNFIASKLNNVDIYQYCYEPYAPFWDPVYVNNSTLIKRFAAYIFKHMYAQSDVSATRKAVKIFTLSPETKHSISSIYNVNSVVTYLGADLDFYRHHEEPSIFEKYKGNQVLLHNTDFSPPKGTEFLLDCMPAIISKIPSAKLLITCSLNDPQKIKKLRRDIEVRGIASNINVLGWVQYELLPCYYSLADLVIYCGTSDGSGASSVSLFVIEAMACETPCLRSNDSKSEVLDGINGELFNPLDHSEFIEKCTSLLANQDLLDLYASKCRSYIENKYSWDSAAKIVCDNLESDKLLVMPKIAIKNE